jgi:hypothetical protein
VLRLAQGTEFADLAIGRGVLAWTTTSATYLASTATGGYLQVTPSYGHAVTGAGHDVLVADPPATKSVHPVLPLHLLPVRPSSLGRCR